MATKKIGVEIAVALAEMTPQTNIAARISESAATSMVLFHPFHQLPPTRTRPDVRPNAGWPASSMHPDASYAFEAPGDVDMRRS